MIAVNPAARTRIPCAARRRTQSRGPTPRPGPPRRPDPQYRGRPGPIEESTPKVAAFLASHPAIRTTHWALEASSRANYLRIARSPGATGGVISFTLRGKLEAFYDRLRLPKGPSFGMRTTLICPFMYLAHYDLVTTPERARRAPGERPRPGPAPPLRRHRAGGRDHRRASRGAGWSLGRGLRTRSRPPGGSAAGTSLRADRRRRPGPRQARSIFRPAPKPPRIPSSVAQGKRHDPVGDERDEPRAP
jgi:hypothetical protein